MSSATFRFRQFTVRHDRCAMRVGTDGVLLGAWARLDAPARRLLDVGTGTGLIALMLAQRAPAARVTALDIDPACVLQARENVAGSPFAERIEVIEGDIKDYEAEGFDHIVSNPPFFTEQTLAPDPRRALARSATSLPADALIAAALRLLAPEGTLSVILPASQENSFRYEASLRGLWPEAVCRVSTTSAKPPRRVMMTLSRKAASAEVETLVIGGEAYKSLTEAFYL